MLLKEKGVENINFQNVISSTKVIGAQQPIFHKYGEVQNNRLEPNLIKNQLKDNPFYNLD